MRRFRHIPSAAAMTVAMLLLAATVHAQVIAGATVTARQRLQEYAAPGRASDEPVKCGLASITLAMQHRAVLAPDVLHALKIVLTRVERQKQKTIGHFTIHYDTANTSTTHDAAALLDASNKDMPGTADAYADSVAAVANSVYDFETGVLGYDAPPPDGSAGGGPEYDIYVQDLGNEYGETAPETQLDTKPDGGRWITYMTIDNDFSFVTPASNKGIPALRVTLAHEFHHAIQLGSYAFWGSDLFYHELTSTWMEDVVFPGVNDYLNYLRASWGQFMNPDVPFNSNDLIMYSRGIWGQYVARQFGRDVMRETWVACRSVRPLEAIDNTLHAHNSSFRLAFAEWVLWNYYTGRRADTTLYYPRGNLFPEVVQTPIDFLPPVQQRSLTGTLPCLAAYYHQVNTIVDTVTLITCNNNITAAQQGSGAEYVYSYSLSSTGDPPDQVGGALFAQFQPDDPGNWKSWNIVGNRALVAGIREGVPFPNPFRPDGATLLYIPAAGSVGTLHIYSSSMDPVYAATENAVAMLGRTMFSWNGVTRNNELATTGIYIFVLELPNRTLTGKIALIRR